MSRWENCNKGAKLDHSIQSRDGALTFTIEGVELYRLVKNCRLDIKLQGEATDRQSTAIIIQEAKKKVLM